jgi:Homing endonuclease associated repeat
MNEKQQEVIQEIRRIASKLNKDSLTKRDFIEHSSMLISTVMSRFGSWNRAIESAGLMPNSNTFEPRSYEARYTEEELLIEIIRLTKELGKEPSDDEMTALGKYSPHPYRKKWGKFINARQIAYAKYGFPEGEESSTQESNKSKVPLRKQEQEIPNSIHKPNTLSSKTTKKVQYGEPIDFRGLRHAPINEQGVVYLFGIVSHELGFLVESVRTGYPDCEGKRCVDEKRQIWERTLIEFEFKSGNFRVHGHDPNECDLIVCWIHDWQDCPLEIIELRSAINRLPK